MRRALSIAFLLFGIVPLCHAYPIAKIDLHGNEQISMREIEEYLHSLPENAYRNVGSRSELLLIAQHVEDAVLHYYNQHGFLRANIDSVRTGLALPADSAQGYAIQIYLHEGRQYRFQKIESASVVAVKAGDVYSDATLHAAIDEALKDYENRGYPLAKIEIAALTLRDDADERYGAVDVRLNELVGIRFASRHVFQGCGVDDDIHPHARQLHPGGIPHVAQEESQPLTAEFVPHLVLFLFVPAKNPDLFDIALEKATQHRIAEGPRSAGDHNLHVSLSSL